MQSSHKEAAMAARGSQILLFFRLSFSIHFTLDFIFDEVHVQSLSRLGMKPILIEVCDPLIYGDVASFDLSYIQYDGIQK